MKSNLPVLFLGKKCTFWPIFAPTMTCSPREALLASFGALLSPHFSHGTLLIHDFEHVNCLFQGNFWAVLILEKLVQIPKKVLVAYECSVNILILLNLVISIPPSSITFSFLHGMV